MAMQMYESSAEIFLGRGFALLQYYQIYFKLLFCWYMVFGRAFLLN